LIKHHPVGFGNFIYSFFNFLFLKIFILVIIINMSGTYWSVGDKVDIGQTDVEIKCEGADQFKENQVIGIYVPPSVSFFSGKDTTLNFDVEIKYPSGIPTKWAIDSVTGANGLFSKCVVYAGNRQTVLETLDHYSSWCSIKYGYDTNDSMKSRRAMVEGCGEWLPSSRGDMGSRKSVQNNHMYSPFIEQANFQGEPTATVSTACAFKKASVSIPIHMGMFANNSKAVPNVLMNGCYLELTCEANARVFRVLDSTTQFRKPALNPTWYGVNTSGAGFVPDDVTSVDIDAGGATYTTGSYTNVTTTSGGSGTGCTLDITVAGGSITVVTVNQGGSGYALSDTLIPDASGIGAGDGNLDLKVGGIGGALTSFLTGKFNSQNDPQHSPFQVGEQVGFLQLSTGTTDEGSNPILITSIENGGSADHPIKYNVSGASLATSSVVNTSPLTQPDWVVYSVRASSVAPTYELSNVRMVVRQLSIEGYESGVLSKMKSGGQILYDIPSVACVVASATKGELQASISIPCEHSKARSLLCMPTDNEKTYSIKENSDSASTYLIDSLEYNPQSTSQAIDFRSDRSGVSGIGDSLSSYNFVIDQKIVPSRKVHTDKSSSKTLGMNADHIIELQNALQQSHGTPPRSVASFRSNFLVGRALTLDENTVYNGIGKDMRLLVRYEGSAPLHNKLWKNFISHVKTVSIQGDSINVMQ
jgi:hypothetical protein